MTQTPQPPRDWQKDMEMCEKVKDSKWLTLESSATAVWQRGGLMSTIWEGVDAEALQQYKAALPYWLQEAKKWRERYEQRPTFELLEAAQALYEHHNARADEAEKQTKVYKQSYEGTLTAWESEKARAAAAEEEVRYQKGVTEDYAKGYRLQELRAIAAEAREQRLKDAVKTIKELSKWDGISQYLDRCYIEARDVLATIYPDTTEPKEVTDNE